MFAEGERRTKAIRDAAWGALRAAGDARDGGHPEAAEAARATVAAASASYLHPIPKATQVKHILGAAAHAAYALDLAETVALAQCRTRASPVVVDVLTRYSAAPAGGGHAGELVRAMDALLRSRGR